MSQTFKDYTIVVVDDGSTDGTEEMISKEFPKVLLLKGDGQLFWTKAINLGLELVLQRSQNDDFILTLNNDLTIQPSYLQVLWEASQKNPGSLIGSLVLNAKDGETIIDGGVRINWFNAKFKKLNFECKYHNILLENNELMDVDVISGRGALVPLRVFKEIGLYDALKLPHYGADYEFSIRAKRKGYNLLMDYKAMVFSQVDTSGINNSFKRLSWRNYFKMFFSIRSPNNLYYRWNFACLSCPRHNFIFYYLFDLIRVIGGSLRNQVFPKNIH